jgi:hypothetical protein
VKRYDPVLLGLFVACWTVVLLKIVGLVSLAGTFPLGFYGLYSLASVLGWSFGNLYVQRTRHLDGPLRRRLLLIFYIGPPGILFLLRSMAPLANLQAAPLVAVYAFGVFSIFFVVPLMFRRAGLGKR